MTCAMELISTLQADRFSDGPGYSKLVVSTDRDLINDLRRLI